MQFLWLGNNGQGTDSRILRTINSQAASSFHDKLDQANCSTAILELCSRELEFCNRWHWLLRGYKSLTTALTPVSLWGHTRNTEIVTSLFFLRDFQWTSFADEPTSVAQWIRLQQYQSSQTEDPVSLGPDMNKLTSPNQPASNKPTEGKMHMDCNCSDILFSSWMIWVSFWNEPVVQTTDMVPLSDNY